MRYRSLLSLLISIVTIPIVAQEWSTVAEPLRRNLILKCDLYRTDYEYRFTNLFFFRRTNQLVGSVKLAPDGMYAASVPIFHGKNTTLYGFTGYIDRLEIYDYYSGYTWYEGYDQNVRYYAGSRISRYDGSYTNIYDYSIFGTCEEIDLGAARESIDQYNAGLEEKRAESASYRLF
jgi:hypothetical protein